MDEEKYVADALKIHGICEDKGLPVEDARLFTYMHVLFSENGNDSSYFGRKDGPQVVALKKLGAEIGKGG